MVTIPKARPGGDPAAPAWDQRLDREVLAMGTRLGIHLEGPHRGPLQEASARILAEVDRIEAACSTRRPGSAWSRLNRAACRAIPLEPEWLDLLEAAQAWSRRTRGTFEPVLKALMDAWGVRQAGPAPDLAARQQALQATGCHLLHLDRAQGTARLDHPLAGLEEGGFVKGYALDAARRVAGVPAGWFDFGGQILSWGTAREVGVADPGERSRERLRVVLAGSASLSCSGCSERGRHLLDPRSGAPCPDWGSVAVVAADGLEAEVLSTALYVHGPEAGLDLARDLDAAAAFLGHDGSVRASPAFSRLAVHRP